MHRSFRTKLYAAALICLPVLSSCDLPIDFWEDKSVTLDLTSAELSSTSIPPQEQDIDINTIPAVASKANLIKTVQIPEVWVKVSNIQPDNVATTVTGKLTVTDPSDATFVPIVLDYENVPILEGGRLDLTPSQDDVTRLQVLIQTKGKFHIQYSGDIDALPAHFDLAGEIHIIATVDVTAAAS